MCLHGDQLLRKRHIGNDIVTIVFQEPGAHPFTPRTIRSHFQHVFVILRVYDPCSHHTGYRWGRSGVGHGGAYGGGALGTSWGRSCDARPNRTYPPLNFCLLSKEI